ncbi:hypothetical protein [Streptomyces sp. NBC_00029]|uniref:hypothetical protein n=1 Tax=Streptomyces sp. NBC_00029 TaxID=2903613 RepID=UPI00386DBBA9
MLCTDGRVRTLVDLALAPEHRRGHGAPYCGLNQGRIDVTRLRRAGRRAVAPGPVAAVWCRPWTSLPVAATGGGHLLGSKNRPQSSTAVPRHGASTPNGAAGIASCDG